MKKPRDIQAIIRIARYSSDNQLNLRGDYDHVAVVHTRKTPSGNEHTRTSSKYFLLPRSPFKPVPLRITRREFLTVCENLFVKASVAENYEGPADKFFGIGGKVYAI